MPAYIGFILGDFKWVGWKALAILAQIFRRALDLGRRPLFARKSPALLGAESKIELLETALRAARGEVEKWKTLDAEAEKSLFERSEELRGTREELRGWKKAWKEKEIEEKQLRACLERASVDLQRAQQIEKEDKRTLTALRIQCNDISDILKVRTLELKDAQQYLSKTDTFSDADILRLVDNLNSQVFQISAQIADSLTFDRTRQPNPGPETPVMLLERSMGSATLELLQTVKHDDDPICVQIALQSCMIAVSGWLIEMWDFVHTAEEDPFERLYGHIRKHGQSDHKHKYHLLTITFRDPGRFWAMAFPDPRPSVPSISSRTERRVV